jgi:phosphopantothenoylcysteine synthetase/decarboxylase
VKSPRVFLTCGPAYEPLDEVRRITNHSTGELGTLLAEALTGAGFHVVCFRGEGTTFRPPPVEIRTFTTNASLERLLQAEARHADAVLHAAALCDFGIQKLPGVKKWKSQEAPPPLQLHPLPKLLPTLRSMFPKAVIVGWKYELDGDRESALTAGQNQLAANATDACAINGAAYGPGFGFLEKNSAFQHLPDKAALCQHLTHWLSGKLTSPDWISQN